VSLARLRRAAAGKTRIVERSNKMVGGGYSAIYFFNSTMQYQMVQGVLRTGSTKEFNFDVDVEMPHTSWYACSSVNIYFSITPLTVHFVTACARRLLWLCWHWWRSQCVSYFEAYPLHS
jgi:hypothetical protein